MDQTNATGAFAKYVVASLGVFATEGTRNGFGTTSETVRAKSVSARAFR